MTRARQYTHIMTTFDLSDGGDFSFRQDGVSVTQRTLRRGLSEGVRVIEIDNGALQFTILPTRGMGLWKGRFGQIDLGWRSPVVGPVHPKFVEQSSRGGLGWLTGFDEWLCRCGLAWNGPPGDDGGFPLTLHGRIANSPAHRVEVRIDPELRTISVTGEVEEGGLFYPRLHLRSTISTRPGSNRLEITDVVTNRTSRPAELQLLYHINQGPPLLGAGSRVRVPVRELWPATPRAAEGIDNWQTYVSPEPGFAEQVYLIVPQCNESGKSAALLHVADETTGLGVRWDAASLPLFNLWKNTAAIEDGYVTGLEPATGFPRFRAREREAGRVRILAAGDSVTMNLALEALDSPQRVASFLKEIDRIQSHGEPVIHFEPLP